LPATTGLMTVEEFLQLPETGPFYYELRHGEPVQVTRPILKHTRGQKTLERLLEFHAANGFVVIIEFPFRALPEHDLRVADVAAISTVRFDQADREAVFRGAPELVIEILSPSNTVAEMNDKEQLCLGNGCREFWVVDMDLRQVKISTPDGVTRTFRAGQQIPLDLFGTGALKVDAIFE
jgi:Uma2 family endonuclease